MLYLSQNDSLSVVGLEILNHPLVHRLGLACCVGWKKDKLNALQSPNLWMGWTVVDDHGDLSFLSLELLV